MVPIAAEIDVIKTAVISKTPPQMQFKIIYEPFYRPEPTAVTRFPRAIHFAPLFVMSPCCLAKGRNRKESLPSTFVRIPSVAPTSSKNTENNFFRRTIQEACVLQIRN